MHKRNWGLLFTLASCVSVWIGCSPTLTESQIKAGKNFFNKLPTDSLSSDSLFQYTISNHSSLMLSAIEKKFEVNVTHLKLTELKDMDSILYHSNRAIPWGNGYLNEKEMGDSVYAAQIWNQNKYLFRRMIEGVCQQRGIRFDNSVLLHVPKDAEDYMKGYNSPSDSNSDNDQAKKPSDVSLEMRFMDLQVYKKKDILQKIVIAIDSRSPIKSEYNWKLFLVSIYPNKTLIDLEECDRVLYTIYTEQMAKVRWKKTTPSKTAP